MDGQKTLKMQFSNLDKDRDTADMFSDRVNHSGEQLIWVQMLRRGEVGREGMGGRGVVAVNR